LRAGRQTAGKRSFFPGADPAEYQGVERACGRQDYSQDQGSRKRAPLPLQRIGGIPHPADLFACRNDEEEENGHRNRRKRDRLIGGERPAGKEHHTAGEEHDRGHQEDDGRNQIGLILW
jgi:hypothetical protein